MDGPGADYPHQGHRRNRDTTPKKTTNAQKEVSMTPRITPRRLEDGKGGTVGAVIDLAHDGHDHDAIMVLHVPQGSLDAEDGPRWLEKLRVPPPGFHYRLHCGDCPSTVTLFSNPPECLAGAYAVTHDRSCPWLGARLAGAR